MFYKLILVVESSLRAFFSLFRKRQYKLPPLYPGALPLIGHAYILLGDNEQLWKTVTKIWRNCVEQGGVIAGFIGTTTYYVITDPEDALTASNSCLYKHYAYDYAKAWLGSGLITGSGETWKRHRRLLTPAFSQPVVHGFLEVFNEQAKTLMKQFDTHCGKRSFDQMAYLRNNALETFCLAAFGIDTMEANFLQKYMKAVDQILTLLTSRFQTAYLHSNLMYTLLGFKSKEAKLIKIVNAMSNKVIQKKRMAMKNHIISEKKYKPLLDLLMELSNADTLSDKEIREEVDTAIVAGFDTTSNLLTYILAYLGTYPDTQEKVYREFIEVLGKDRDVQQEDLKKLVYTTAVIKETLRVIPTGPVLLRYVNKDVKLKKYTMNAGSQCLLLPHGTHRHSVWGKDCEEFRPERWLDTTTLPDEASAFGGFSWGKRNCIGKTYALTTMKVTLAHLLRRYKVQADVSKMELRLDFLLKPTRGHEITIERRYCS